MKLNATKTLILAALAVCGAASAQTKAPEPDYTLSYNAGVVTDYRYRGISQSRLDPALQGGIDWAHKNGVYLGAWGSTIQWIRDAGGDARVELDLYGGYKGTVGDLGYDLGVLTYQYPSNRLNPSANTTELYGALTLGAFTAKYSHSTGNLFGFADSRGSGYLDVSASFDLGQGWSVAPHVGHQRVKNNGAASYTDYSVTLAKDLGNGLSASVAAVGTDADRTVYLTPAGRFTGRNAVVLGLKYSF